MILPIRRQAIRFSHLCPPNRHGELQTAPPPPAVALAASTATTTLTTPTASPAASRTNPKPVPLLANVHRFSVRIFQV